MELDQLRATARTARLPILLVALLSIAFACVAVSVVETPSSEYATYEGLLQDSEILEGGWVPNWLPKSSIEIQESHNIDTNQGWLSFKFDPIERFPGRECRSMSKQQITLPREVARWRTSGFAVRIRKALVSRNDLKFFACNDAHERFLALDEIAGLAYIWMLSS